MSPAGIEPTPGTTPVNDRKVSVLDRSDRGLDGDQWFNVLQDNGIQI